MIVPPSDTVGVADRFTVVTSVVSGTVVVATGLFAFGEIIANLERGSQREVFTSNVKGLWPTREDLRLSWKAIVRGTGIGAVLMVVGSCIGATGRRFWSGLAGGAGLAIAGVLGAAVGTGVGLLDTTKVRFVTSGATVTLTTTYGVGWVLAVSAAGLGGVVFLVSLPASTDDHRRRLGPFVALLGIVALIALVPNWFDLAPSNRGLVATAAAMAATTHTSAHRRNHEVADWRRASMRRHRPGMKSVPGSGS